MARSLFFAIIIAANLVGSISSARAAEAIGLVTALAGPSLDVKLGDGIEAGRIVVVEPESRLRVTDILGNQYIILGKAQVSFTSQGQILVHNGSVKVQSAHGQIIQVNTIYLNGSIDGKAVVWISTGKTQWMTLDGVAKTWHPQLPETPVSVDSGYFTEISNEENYLQPHSPMEVEVSKAKVFLAKFGDPIPESLFRRTQVVEHKSQEVVRAPAAIHEKIEVVEKADPEIMARLKAHIQGQDYEDLKAEMAQQAMQNKKVQSATRLKYMSRVLAREQAYRKLMGSAPQGAQRAPASAVKTEIDAEDASELEEHKQKEDAVQHGIINRLIKGDVSTGRSLK